VSRNGYYLPSMFSAAFVILILPTLVALIRRADRMGTIVFFNALTLVTGVAWFVAMLMACMMPRRVPPQPFFSSHGVTAAPPPERPENVTYFVWWTG
jgi:Superinfection immunity protein